MAGIHLTVSAAVETSTSHWNVLHFIQLKDYNILCKPLRDKTILATFGKTQIQVAFIRQFVNVALLLIWALLWFFCIKYVTEQIVFNLTPHSWQDSKSSSFIEKWVSMQYCSTLGLSVFPIRFSIEYNNPQGLFETQEYTFVGLPTTSHHVCSVYGGPTMLIGKPRRVVLSGIGKQIVLKCLAVHWCIFCNGGASKMTQPMMRAKLKPLPNSHSIVAYVNFLDGFWEHDEKRWRHLVHPSYSYCCTETEED